MTDRRHVAVRAPARARGDGGGGRLLHDIETALGDDASPVLPAAIRTCELRARVPRYQVAMLEHFAGRESTTVSRVLTRELEDVASAHADELSSAIPGFAAALEWPDAVEPLPAC